MQINYHKRNQDGGGENRIGQKVTFSFWENIMWAGIKQTSPHTIKWIFITTFCDHSSTKWSMMIDSERLMSYVFYCYLTYASFFPKLGLLGF